MVTQKWSLTLAYLSLFLFSFIPYFDKMCPSHNGIVFIPKFVISLLFVICLSEFLKTLSNTLKQIPECLTGVTSRVKKLGPQCQTPPRPYPSSLIPTPCSLSLTPSTVPFKKIWVGVFRFIIVSVVVFIPSKSKVNS